MIKVEKGITMITLVLTIIVILIIAGITLQGSKRLLKESELKNDITDMLLIQARAEVIYDKNQFDETIKLVGLPINEEIANTYGIEVEQIGKWYIWNNEEATSEENVSAKGELEALNVNLKNGEFYIVNYEIGEIIYSAGYKDAENNMVYKLSDMQNISNNE